jgi:hypothetical protein
LHSDFVRSPEIDGRTLWCEHHVQERAVKFFKKPVRERRLASVVCGAQVALTGLLSVGAFAALLFAASTTFAGGM